MMPLIRSNKLTSQKTRQYHPVARRGFLLVIWMHTQMGDCRPLKTPRMGDVMKSNISDGVFIK